jgi:hypothetical protein
MYGYDTHDCVPSTLAFLGLIKNKSEHMKLMEMVKDTSTGSKGLSRSYATEYMKSKFPKYDFWFDNVKLASGKGPYANLEYIFNNIEPGDGAYGSFSWSKDRPLVAVLGGRERRRGGHAIVLAKTDGGEPFIVDLHKSGKNATKKGIPAILNYFQGILQSDVELEILQSSIPFAGVCAVGDGKRSSHCSPPIFEFEKDEYDDGDTGAKLGTPGRVTGKAVLAKPYNINYQSARPPRQYGGGRRRRRCTRRKKAKRRRTRRKKKRRIN